MIPQRSEGLPPKTGVGHLCSSNDTIVNVPCMAVPRKGIGMVGRIGEGGLENRAQINMPQSFRDAMLLS